jgi:hypothetical protein
MTQKMREFKERLRNNYQTSMAEYARYETEKSKMALCIEFIETLATLLGESYEMIGSCNKDASKYLVPAGTTDQITYYGKPTLSFRVSDHWSWYSNLKKCAEPSYIQCYSIDAPVPKPRPIGNPGQATKPVMGKQVCIQLADGMYHHVFGDKFDRKTHKWTWVENDPAEVLAAYGL